MPIIVALSEIRRYARINKNDNQKLISLNNLRGNIRRPLFIHLRLNLLNFKRWCGGKQ